MNSLSSLGGPVLSSENQQHLAELECVEEVSEEPRGESLLWESFRDACLQAVSLWNDLRGGRSFQYRGQTYRTKPTSSQGLSCAIHALRGTEDEHEGYLCPAEGGVLPRDHFVRKLEEIITWEGNEQIAAFSPRFQRLKERYLAALREFFGETLPTQLGHRFTSLFPPLPCHGSEAERQKLTALLQKWRDVTDPSERGLHQESQDVREERFLLQKKVFSAYLDCVGHPQFPFEMMDLLLLACSYNLNVRVFSGHPGRGVLVPTVVEAGAHISDSEGETIYIFQSRGHFERCERVEGVNEEVVARSREERDYFLSVVFWFVGWGVLFCGMVCLAVWKIFKTRETLVRAISGAPPEETAQSLS